MKKHLIFLSIIILLTQIVLAQETLQSVTDRGNTTNQSLQIGGNSVNANSTKLFINNPLGKNWALSSGANMISEQGFYIYNWTDQPGSPLFSLSNSGNLGIGTVAPAAKLDVNGNIKSNGYIDVAPGTAFRLYDGVNFTGGLGSSSWAGGLGLNLYSTAELTFSVGSVEKGRWLNNGNLGIGTTNPDEKLTVKGKIHAEEVKVDLSVPGPDYVFEENYKLTPLSEIQSYVKSNKHLPDVPSAKEMETNGINLSEMNMLLLKKVEELTLHLIKKDKEIILINKKLKAIEKTINNIRR